MTSVLVVDDDADIATFLCATLEAERFDVRSAASGQGALDQLRAELVDIVLLDLGLPDLDGLEVCRRLRADPRTSSTPVMLLTGRTGSGDKVAGLGAGADDYVIKPFDTMELVARVRALLRRNADMRAVSPLTLLPGNSRINAEIERRTTSGVDFALCYVDLDNFKAFNDRYGWVRGDKVILLLAEILQRVVGDIEGPQAFVGHVGGDDFCVLCSIDQAEAMCDEIIAAFDGQVRALHDEPDVARGHLCIVDRQGNAREYPLASVSIGVATTDQRQFGDPRDVVAVATEMKTVAKGRSGSAVAIDRRRDPGAAP